MRASSPIQACLAVMALWALPADAQTRGGGGGNGVRGCVERGGGQRERLHHLHLRERRHTADRRAHVGQGVVAEQEDR